MANVALIRKTIYFFFKIFTKCSHILITQFIHFRYRVCAFKNGKSFDARGHFSAGQRVLACIIIRLALAEVFAGHCGILALDEPTTNLDQANISSLAKSLNKLVEEREFQNNFMLLIITHDENFMGKMGRPGKCYRIERNVLDGTSRIKENND